MVDECNRQRQDRYISGVISGNSKSVRNNRNNHSYLIMTGNNQVYVTFVIMVKLHQSSCNLQSISLQLWPQKIDTGSTWYFS